MYRTSLGERTLRGAEHRLFVGSLAMLVDYLSGGDYDAGIALFDDLQRNQKIAVLLGVSNALLHDNVSPPPLTAISEAAVAVVYQHLEERLIDEIREGGREDHSVGDDAFGPPIEDVGPSWRTLVLNACRETNAVERLPQPDDSNEDNWSFLIECLRDRVLWDNDWEMVEQQDIDPDQQRRVKEEMGIDEDYFVWVPPDPKGDLAARMLTELQYLTPEGRGLGDSPEPEP